MELERPSAEVRRRLWEKMLPQAGLASPFNLGALARFELSGAEIRVVILRASTRAAAEGVEGLTQTLVEEEADALLGSQQKKVSIGFGRRGA